CLDHSQRYGEFRWLGPVRACPGRGGLVQWAFGLPGRVARMKSSRVIIGKPRCTLPPRARRTCTPHGSLVVSKPDGNRTARSHGLIKGARMRVTVCSVLALAPLAGQAEEPEALKRALPRLPATAATDAVATFRIARGFRIELVASEPHVCSPVD